MASVYKVTEIEGKGLGCVATVDIEKGSDAALAWLESRAAGPIGDRQQQQRWVRGAFLFVSLAGPQDSKAYASALSGMDMAKR